MNKLFYYSVMIISIFIISCDSKNKSNDIPGDSTMYTQNINKNTPAFKGLNLGISKSELINLSTDNKFNWKYVNDKILHYKNDEQSWIGCEGEGNKKVCYEFVGAVHTAWDEDKLVEFEIRSPYLHLMRAKKYISTEMYINEYLRNWIKFAIKGLAKKYNEPSGGYSLKLDNLDRSSFPSDSIDTIAIFKINASYKIFVGISSDRPYDTESENYYCVITYRDVDAFRNIEKKKRANPKYDF